MNLLLLIIQLSAWGTCCFQVIARDTVVTLHQRTILIISALDFDIFKPVWSDWLNGYCMPFFSLLNNRKSRSAGNWCSSFISCVYRGIKHLKISHLTWALEPNFAIQHTDCIDPKTALGHSVYFFWWTTLCSTIKFTLPVGDMAWTANIHLNILKRIMSSGTEGRMKI